MTPAAAPQSLARRPWSSSRITPGPTMRWCLSVTVLMCLAAVAAQPAVLDAGASDSTLVMDSGQFATGLAMPNVSTLRLQGLALRSCARMVMHGDRPAHGDPCPTSCTSVQGCAPTVSSSVDTLSSPRLCCVTGTLTLLPSDYSTPIIVSGRDVTIQPGALHGTSTVRRERAQSVPRW